MIIADGGREQLTEWLGGPRHLFDVEGEPLLHRTVRQFSSHGEVIILGPPEYEIPPAETIQPDQCVEWCGVAMLAKALPHVADRNRTNLVFGDVWFSDKAVDTIVGYESEEWRIFGRPKPSQITGTGWGEYFCISLWPEHKELLHMAMYRAFGHWRDGSPRLSPWEVYHAMEGMPMTVGHGNPVPTGPHWVTIDDWTDDFDFPEDVVRWKARRPKS